MADRAYAIEHSFQSAVVADGNGTAMNVGGLSGVGVQVEGITTATVTFEGTIDGATWYAVQAMNVNDGAKATSTAADGLFLAPVAGFDKLRCRISGYFAGTITVSGKGVVNPAGVTLAGIDTAAPATPTVYNVTLTVANTQYSQAMPANCRGFEFQARTEATIRYAFVTGKVATPTAPWLTLKAGDYYFSPPLNQGASPGTLFLGTATAGTIVEILAWA